MWAPLDAPPHLPDSTPQSRYHTRRASATPVAPTQIPPRGPPTKKAKTSEPGESSRVPRDSQSQPPSTRRPRPSSPIEGNSDCRSRAFHVEAYFDHTVLRQQTKLRDSYSLLERVFWGLDRLPRLSISLMHQLIPLHLDAGPHFLIGTWFISYLEGHLPRGPFSGGSFPQGCS